MKKSGSVSFFDGLKPIYYFIKKYILIGIIIFLLILGIALTIYSHYYPDFNAIVILSGISTYAVALFTAIYAYLSSKQVDEIVTQRELQYQPLPWITEIKATIAKPRTFFSEGNKHIFCSRYFIYLKLKNLSNHPAVNIDISATLSNFDDSKVKRINSAEIRIETLEEKQDYPRNPAEKCNFMFTGDDTGELIKSLLSGNTSKFPRISIIILYKNIIGGCFIITNTYSLFPLYNHKEHKNQEEILKNWIGL